MANIIFCLGHAGSEKSLLLSTIEAYFLGKSELFEGLAISEYEKVWESRPVFHIDLNVQRYADIEHLTERLDVFLKSYEKEYGVEQTSQSPAIRFEKVIKAAYEANGKQVVILIDEYDKPLVANLHDERLVRDCSDMLAAFYGVIKSLDRYIKFAMLTGVSRFGKLSVFSGLNNLLDISLEDRFAGICGITHPELLQYFGDGISRLANKLSIDTQEAIALLRHKYDGCHFSASLLDIYNPFSLLSAFSNVKLEAYWFETGTPKFLVDILRDNDYELDRLDGVVCSEQTLKASDQFRTNIVPMLFQTGYLTITGYNSRFQSYTLGYPNEEVRQAFMEYLVQYYTPRRLDSKGELQSMVEEVEQGQIDMFLTRMKAFFAGFPYDQIPNLEVHYQNVIYIITKMMGFYVRTEYKTSDGRIDLLIETGHYVYIIECKLRGTAKSALKQINDEGYASPYQASGKTIIKVGVAFDPNKHAIRNWLVER